MAYWYIYIIVLRPRLPRDFIVVALFVLFPRVFYGESDKVSPAEFAKAQPGQGVEASTLG